MKEIRDQDWFRTDYTLWPSHHRMTNCCRANMSYIWSKYESTVFALLLLLLAMGCNTRNSIDHGVVTYDISPSGTHVAFSSTSGDLFLLDIPTRNVKQVTKTQNIESSPAFSPDGVSIIFSSATPDQSTAHILRCGISDRKTKQLTLAENVYDAYPCFSSDGSKVIFSRAHRFRTYSMGGMVWDDWDVYMMDADGDNVTRLTKQKYRSVVRPCFSLDGQAVYYSARIKRQDSSLYSAIFEVSTTGGQQPKNLTPDDDNNTGCAAMGAEPTLSPNGNRIAFISDRNKRYQYDLFVMNADGSNPTPLNLSNVSKYLAFPLFSPEGANIYFLAETAKNANSQPLFSLWIVDATGKNPLLIGSTDLFNKPLQWKADRLKDKEK